jgi:predicted RNA-binding Zn-ribbon protein involved in translation (DUF1610 family)
MHAARGDNFANARDVRNVFERSVASHANRVGPLENPSDEVLCTLLTEDLPGGEAHVEEATRVVPCRDCGAKLRVPRGRGAVLATCPRCGEKQEVEDVEGPGDAGEPDA